MDMMYEMPSDDNVEICTVTEATSVEGSGKPELVYRDLTVPRKTFQADQRKTVRARSPR